jgi:hypothetical protein
MIFLAKTVKLVILTIWHFRNLLELLGTGVRSTSKGVVRWIQAL